MVEFRLLGGFEVLAEGRRVDVGHARQRDVLVVLLLEAGRTVPLERLADRVWGEQLPRSPKDALYSYLSRLRTALSGLVTIRRQDGGYRLDTDPLTVDVHRFARLVERAKAAEEDVDALALYDEALALWRGRPLDELESPWLTAVREDLDRQRRTALLGRNEVRLRCGRHADVLAELDAEDLLDERVAAQFVEALWLDGRPADALREYERIRVRLAEELGADPGPYLRELHQRILTADVGGPVPRQLPPSPAAFAGRTAELAELDALAPAGTVVIAAAGGFGKTWLALRWAAANASRFPDGQLYVNLRGFDPAGEPVPPSVAVRELLGALGVTPGAIPAGLDAQAALYRSLTTGRRMLIVLDNARDTEQVVPLLPGGASCTVLVTSRNRLGGLLATHGARSLALPTLPDAEAREVLERRLGPARLQAEPEAVAEILAHCGGLSLALGIVAARAAAEPGFALADLVTELRETRLDALDAGELPASLRAVFSASYRALDAEAARAFRLLGLVPGSDVGRAAAVAMLGDGSLLRVLTTANLLTESPPGRFRMHDLVRLYAAEQAGPEESEAALTRLFDHYLHWAGAAMNHFSPNEPYRRPPVAPSPAFAEREEAWAWLDAELPGLLAMGCHAVMSGTADVVVRLAETIGRYLEVRAHYHDWLATQRAAMACTASGSLKHATAEQQVAGALLRLGEFGASREHYERALACALAHGAELLESMCRSGLGSLDEMQGRMGESRREFELALAAARRTGYALLEGIALCNLGDHFYLAGDYEESVRYLELSGQIALDLPDGGLGGFVLSALGRAYAALGWPDVAIGHHRRAVEMASSGRNPNLEVVALKDFGEVVSGMEAIGLHEQALVLARRIGHRYEAARAHYGLGRGLLGQGKENEARVHLEAALASYRELDAHEADEVLVLLGDLG